MRDVTHDREAKPRARLLGIQSCAALEDRSALSLGDARAIILDLNFEAVDPLQLITKLKGSADTKGISVIGYLSHVQGELKQQAQEAGCDMVLARSAFSQSMPLIFKRHSGSI